MPFISDLYIYPVKSLGGIRIDAAELTDRGFKYDRRWMLVDNENRFLTQREYPQMALLQTSVTDAGILVYKKNNADYNFIIPFAPQKNERVVVNIWDDICQAVTVSNEADEWFSNALGMACRLVYMPDDSLRKVDVRYALEEEDVTSFSDAYPVLIISKESLQDLNSRMQEPLPMNRFRPNIVVEGCEPYEEDTFYCFQIRDINFYGVKLCGRCVLTTVNQDTAEKAKEPLKTLYTYRARNNNVYFGQNVLYHGTGIIQVGEEVVVIKKIAEPVFETGN